MKIKPNPPTPEERDRLDEQRILSDAALIGGGAGLENGLLKLNEGQKASEAQEYANKYADKIAAIEASRARTTESLRWHGAEEVDGKLFLTEKQKRNAREEMLYEQNSEYRQIVDTLAFVHEQKIDEAWDRVLHENHDQSRARYTLELAALFTAHKAQLSIFPQYQAVEDAIRTYNEGKDRRKQEWDDHHQKFRSPNSDLRWNPSRRVYFDHSQTREWNIAEERANNAIFDRQFQEAREVWEPMFQFGLNLLQRKRELLEEGMKAVEAKAA